MSRPTYFAPLVTVTERKGGGYMVKLDWFDSAFEAPDSTTEGSAAYEAACEAVDRWVKSLPPVFLIPDAQEATR